RGVTACVRRPGPPLALSATPAPRGAASAQSHAYGSSAPVRPAPASQQLGRAGATSNSFWRATGGFVVLGADDSTVTRACISQDRVGYSWGASDGTGTTNAIVGAIKSAHCVGSLCGLSFACGDGGTSGPEALSACLQDSSCVFLNYSRGEVLLLERPLALAVCDPARSDAYAGLLLRASADVDACPDSSGVVSVALLATVSSVAVIAASVCLARRLRHSASSAQFVHAPTPVRPATHRAPGSPGTAVVLVRNPASGASGQPKSVFQPGWARALTGAPTAAGKPATGPPRIIGAATSDSAVDSTASSAAAAPTPPLSRPSVVRSPASPFDLTQHSAGEASLAIGPTRQRAVSAFTIPPRASASASAPSSSAAASSSAFRK
ncbi:unnamed protein product, partial [Symbiodinium sp. KB8]